jgi:hypothetical protein
MRPFSLEYQKALGTPDPQHLGVSPRVPSQRSVSFEFPGCSGGPEGLSPASGTRRATSSQCNTSLGSEDCPPIPNKKATLKGGFFIQRHISDKADLMPLV